MKDTKVYSLVFTVVLCCVCAGMLTFANDFWSELIRFNEDYKRSHAIVDALGLVTPETPREQVTAIFKSSIQAKIQGEMEIIEGRRDGELVGYAVDFQTRGKYGPIKGILAIYPDKRRVRALRIYQQEETPGLGGRIGTMEWMGKWNDLSLYDDAGNAGIEITSKETGPNMVDAISNASKTCHSLNLVINSVIAGFLSGGMRLEPLDLGTTKDAITSGTPGYPKNTVPPPHLRAEVKRPPFMVPPGLTNLARGKPVTSSMEEEPLIGQLSQLTDGILKSTDLEVVEFDPGPQYAQIDLGDVYTLFAVVVWHDYKNPVIYRDVIVQVSEEPEFSAPITLLNNDHDDSSGLGQGSDPAYWARWWGEIADARGPDKAGTRGRYIRVYTNGGEGEELTRMVEVKVYGK